MDGKIVEGEAIELDDMDVKKMATNEPYFAYSLKSFIFVREERNVDGYEIYRYPCNLEIAKKIEITYRFRKGLGRLGKLCKVTYLISRK